MLPSLAPIPGPELQPIKDQFDEWMKAQLLVEVERQFVEGNDEDRTRISAWIQRLHGESIAKPDLAHDPDFP